MEEKFDFTVPAEELPKPPTFRALHWLLVLTCIIAGATFSLVLKNGASLSRTGRAENSVLSLEAIEALAVRLETRGLAEPAARAWKEYLAGGEISLEAASKVWYRIGKIYQQDGAYEEALDAYFRAESIAKVRELEGELGRRIQESLEGAGKFAALRHELRDRVEITADGNPAAEKVLAEIGPERITQAAVDARIEAQIEQQLSVVGAALPKEELAKRKEEVFKKLSSAENRGQMLQQIVLEELLYRRAREERLSDKPEVRTMLKDMERQILASQVIQEEVARKIHITESDLKTYFDAHPENYRIEARAEVSHILLEDEVTAKEVLDELAEGAPFEDLASKYSTDSATKENGGVIASPIEAGSMVPELGYSEEIVAQILGGEGTELIPQPVKSEKGFHVVNIRTRTPARERPFSEVKHEVYRALRQQKEQEFQGSLFRELQKKYDVVIHHSALQPEAPPAEAPPQ